MVKNAIKKKEVILYWNVSLVLKLSNFRKGF